MSDSNLFQSDRLNRTASKKPPNKITKKMYIIFGFVFVIIGLSLLILNGPWAHSAEAKPMVFASLSKFALNPEIGVNYTIVITTPQNPPVEAAASLERLQGNFLITVDQPQTGSEKFYYVHNMAISCISNTCLSMGAPSYFGNKLLNETYFVNDFTSILNGSNVVYEGQRNVSGRSCNYYNVGMDYNQIYSFVQGLSNNPTSPPQSSSNLSVTAGICLDGQYGYPALINASINVYSPTENKSVTAENVLIVATAISKNPSQTLFAPSAGYMIDEAATPSGNSPEVLCFNGSVTVGFTSLKNLNNVTVLIKNMTIFNLTSSGTGDNLSYPGRTFGGSIHSYTNSTGNYLTFGENYTATVPTNIIAKGYPVYEMDLCVGGSCGAISCLSS